MAFNPGDVVKIINWPSEQFAGGTVLGGNFGGNGGFGVVQATSAHPNSTVQWVFVKCHPQGAVYRLPAANVQAAPGATAPLPLPTVQAGYTIPGHHNAS